MNFRTTILLLVVLAVVGVALLLTRPSGDETTTQAPSEAKLIEITPADVSRIAITAADGQKTVMEKDAGNWRLTEPVKAAADPTAVTGMIEAVGDLHSQGQVPADESTGLDKPRYTLELTVAGKPIKLDVGNRSAAGNSLYVRKEGASQADVVESALADKLDQPLKQWRQARLFEVSAPQITRLQIATTRESIAMEKDGANWKMSQPTSMPADLTAVSDLTTAIAGLRAQDFIEPAPDQARRYGLDKPVLSIAFSTAPPSTQPSTSQPAMTTVKFGRYDGLLNKNVYASISTEPGVVTVASSVLERFNKTPLELRDKQVLNLDPQLVSRMQIAIDRAATTQPTTKEAFHDTVILERQKEMTGPFVLPATAPSTGPATSPTTLAAATQPTTAEEETPTYKWIMTSRDGAEADDTKVQAVLDALHPLRAMKFLKEAPSSKVDETVVLMVETPEKVHRLRITDPGTGQPVVVEYDGLMFEASRTILDDLSANFAEKTPPPPAMPEGMPAGLPPGMMGGQ
jgi:hypothetical protein